MVCYFYKNEYNKVISYISCTWLGNELDLSDSSIDATTPICQLTVVNSEQDSYKGTVKYKDLDDFRTGTVTLDILNTLIKVGLQGAGHYKGDKIAWKTMFNKEDCQMTLIGFLRQALPVHIGTFQLYRVPDSEKQEIWMEWMEKTTSQFKILRETQDALTLRNEHLEKEFKQMKTVAEDLVIQKTSTDLVLMAKFKELLNQKKRKIRRLAIQLEKVKDTSSSTTTTTTTVQSPTTNTSSSIKRKIPTSNIQPEASSSTAKKRTPNIKEETIRSTDNNNKITMNLQSDSESDDFTNDLPLTTTQSRLRKSLYAKKSSSSNKSDNDSDNTTDDDEI